MADRHFILGTAGHIDHGKSSLVKALTGVDPDRLPEEKARGMTIELGFANLPISAHDDSGDTLNIGVVDVPGHADFVKNMVAGVGSIDLALFVVAADDGWMPQTEEHYQILHYLRVPNAIVALTKTDLVEDLELVLEDLNDHLEGGDWENIAVVPTSSETGEGIEELKTKVAEMLTKADPVRDVGKPRLPVDRAFSPKGIGSVVTGTLTGGTIKSGTEMILQPAGLKAQIRNVQSHSSDQDTVFPGTRTALNLSGVGISQRGKEGVWRGDVVTDPKLGEPVRTIDISLEKSKRGVDGQPGSLLPIKSGRRILFHYGSGSHSARMHFLEKKILEPGDTALAELRFDDPIFVFAGDRFVIRDASKAFTIAGGVVLDENANPRMFRKPWQEIFLKARATDPDNLEVLVRSQMARDKAILRKGLLAKSRFAESEIEEVISSLIKDGTLAESGTWIFDSGWWDKVSGMAAKKIQASHQANPDLPGLPIKELRAGMEPELPNPKFFDMLLEGLLGGDFVKAGAAIRATDHKPELPAALEKAGAHVRRTLEKDLVLPPNKAEVAPGVDEQKALRFLIHAGEVVEVDAKTVISNKGYQKIKNDIIAHLKKEGRATASELRQVSGTTRRILMPLLERLDFEKVTAREGDHRSLL